MTNSSWITAAARRTLMCTVTVLALAVSARADITVKGSDTMIILAQKWAEVYMAKYRDVKLQVTGGGSGIGIAALLNRGTDVATASRPMKPAEIAQCLRLFGRRPTEYKVALDGLTVYVHESNPVKDLSLEQLRLIFTGKIRNWKEVGGPDARITVYSRENSSGTYEFFKEHVLLGRDFTARAQTMPGTAAVIQAVAKDKNGIGYGGVAYAKGVKALAVRREPASEPIAPTEEAVVKGIYPIWRFLFMYVNPELDKGQIADFIKWVRSDEGQKVVADVGFYPLPQAFRHK
jgi:phosphate transport system substrate-binding protein